MTGFWAWGAVVAGLWACGAQAQDLPAPFVCPALAPPVVRLDHGSRYTSTDKSRSDFDTVSNAEVNKQLKPVDDFITDMSLAANAAVQSGDLAAVRCVVSGLDAWAQAGALGDIGSMNAGLSMPSRLAGFAWAWAEVKPMVPEGQNGALIESWLSGLAQSTIVFFETTAPPNSRKNNLRAWAGLAVARVGVTLNDPDMLDWADASVRLVACGADPDGSLPLEMARKDLALHYQLHALGALVTTAALLQRDGHTLFEACEGALHRAIRFTVRAFDDPALVTQISGAKQSFFDGSDRLQGFELAWTTAYLATFYAPDIAAFAAPFGDMANSKLGGLQSLLWPGPP